MTELILPGGKPVEVPVVCFKCGLQHSSRAPGISDAVRPVSDNAGTDVEAVIHEDHEGFDDCLALLRIKTIEVMRQARELSITLRQLKATHDALTERHNEIAKERRDAARTH